MDETKNKIRDFFTMLSDSFFKEININQVVDMSEEEQTVFTLAQSERLLGERDTDGISSAVKLSALFWNTGSGRKPVKGTNNPLMMPSARELMDDDERLLCSFYLTLAGFCHDLVYHFSFDPMLLGLTAEEEFFIDNTELVDFVKRSPYDLINANIACIMRREAVSAVDEAGYQVASDYLSRIWYAEGNAWVSQPGDAGITSKEYVKLVLSALTDVENHLREGLEKKIPQTVIFVHDELFGKFMSHYDAAALKLAAEVVKYIDNACYVKSTGQMSGRKLGKQPGAKDVFMKRFADKLEELHVACPGTEQLLSNGAAINYLNSRMEQKAMEE